MKKGIATIFLLCICPVCLAADETTEPPIEYFLQIDGKVHTLKLNKEYRIPGIYNNPSVMLKAGASRTFDVSGLTFQYPASFTWDPPSRTDKAKQWTLSGSDCKIMVIALGRTALLEDYVNYLTETFRKKLNTRPIVENFSRKLGNKLYQGKTLNVKQPLAARFELYAVPTSTGTCIITIQDKVPPNKNMSAEAKQAIEMLSKTMKTSSR